MKRLAFASVIALLLFSPGLLLGQRAVLKAEFTPVYETPSAESRQIAVLAAGDTVEILKIENGWVQLAFGQRQGWMNVRDQKPKQRRARASLPKRLGAKRGGISLHVGSFSKDFSYVGRFHYKSTPSIHMEGTFQYAAGKLASLYLMHLNFRRLYPLGGRVDGWVSIGAGVVTSVPIRSAGSKSVSNMAFNYGLGARRHMKNSNWFRVDVQRFSIFVDSGLQHFLSWTIGIEIGVP